MGAHGARGDKTDKIQPVSNVVIRCGYGFVCTQPHPSPCTRNSHSAFPSDSNTRGAILIASSPLDRSECSQGRGANWQVDPFHRAERTPQRASGDRPGPLRRESRRAGASDHTASAVYQKCLGHSSTDASGPASLLLLTIAVLFLVVAPTWIRCLGTLGGSGTSDTPH